MPHMYKDRTRRAYMCSFLPLFACLCGQRRKMSNSQSVSHNQGGNGTAQRIMADGDAEAARIQ